MAPNNIDEIKQKILPILRRYLVKWAGLFGSLVRDERRISTLRNCVRELQRSLVSRVYATTRGNQQVLVEFSQKIRRLCTEISGCR